jgi:hypothetical protein
MKTYCDHCDHELPESKKDLAKNHHVIWCDDCMRSDYELLWDIGLIDTTGNTLPNVSPTKVGHYKIAANVAKILAIPKKVSTPFSSMEREMAEEMKDPPPAPTEPPADPPFDFDHYNSLDYAYKLLRNK